MPTNTVPAPVAGVRPARLVNGHLAHPGIADATGAIQYNACPQGHAETCWELVGSGVLVAPGAILTAAHCFRGCTTREKVRFFLPGVGAVGIESCHAISPPPDTFCDTSTSAGNAELAPDLAFAILEEPVHVIEPVKLPPPDWELATATKARVSGFGTTFDAAFPHARRRSGLKQYADVPVGPHQENPFRLLVGSKKVRLASKDSGGPLVRKKLDDLIGIAVVAPFEAIRLSGATLSWVRERLADLSQPKKTLKLKKFDCLYCPTSDEEGLALLEADNRRIDPLREGQRLTVTMNAVVRRSPVAMVIAPAGEEPELCRDGVSGFHESIRRDEATDKNLFVWFEACKRDTWIQIWYTVTEPV